MAVRSARAFGAVLQPQQLSGIKRVVGFAIAFVNLAAAVVTLRVTDVGTTVWVVAVMLSVSGLVCGGYCAATWVVGRLRREQLHLRAEIERLQMVNRNDRHQYTRALDALVLKPPLALLEQRDITQEIGETENGDHTVDAWITEPVKSDQPVTWHLFATGAEGAPVPVKTSFQELPEVRASERLDGRDLPLSPVSLSSNKGMIRGLVVFHAPLTNGCPRQWCVRYSWPGRWNPLRVHAVDRYSLNLTEADAGAGVVWGTVAVRFIFPREQGGYAVCSSHPSVFTMEQATGADGRLVVNFIAQQPPPDLYTWELGLDRLEQSASTPGASATFGA